MNYIVFDLEWNQAPVPALEHPGIPFEIIEIGAVKLDEELNQIGEFSRLIKPRVYKKMHTHTKRIIKLSMEDLKSGDYFTDVMREFLAFAGDDPVFCTWGPQDLTELQRNMTYYKMKPLADGPLPFLDVQKLYAIAFNEPSTRRSLEGAIENMDISKDISFHRALGDASYTAKILAELPDFVLEYHSYDLFLKPRDKDSEIHHIFPDYEKYISRKFDNRHEALSDEEIRSCACYLCKKKIKPVYDWFTPNGKHYYSLGRCSKHGYVKSKVRLHKAAEDRDIYVVRTRKLMDEAVIKEFDKLKERAKYFKELPKKSRKNVHIPR